jgi:hypothetical protein
MLICEFCKQTYSENDATPRTEQLYIDGRLVHEDNWLECDCGGMLIPAKICPVCHENYMTEDEALCVECFETSCTFENCKEMGIEATENIDINGFLAFVFSDKEIEKILKNAFESMPESDQKLYIKKYCEEDVYFLASWLEERNKNDSVHKWNNQ